MRSNTLSERTKVLETEKFSELKKCCRNTQKTERDPLQVVPGDDDDRWQGDRIRLKS